MDRNELSDWLDSYERAWRSPGTDSLTQLFTENATYSTGPYENPRRGLEAIASMWEGERLGPDEEFEMTSEVVAVDGDTGVARVEVRYGPPKKREYRDLWIVRLEADGRCSHFEEWPFWPPGSGGQIAAGAASG
jgi:ketosteroid isomerase-like protein